MSDRGSVGVELVNEIERISAKRERWRLYAKDFGSPASYAPAIAVMTADIEEAKAALVSDDPIRVLRIYETLKAYDDED